MVFDELVGLLKIGTIVSVNKSAGTMQVSLDTANPLIKGQSSKPVNVPIPYSMFYNNGLFIGSLPVVGTPIVIGQGSGNNYYFISFLPNNVNKLPSLKENEIVLQTNNFNKISIIDNSVKIGSNLKSIHIKNSNNSLINVTTDNFYSFTQGSRSVVGVVKRDLKPNINYSQISKLEKDDYEDFLIPIGMDKSFTTNKLTTTSKKNPSLIENRNIIYEFANDNKILDDYNESLLYSGNKQQSKNYVLPDRRQSRSDTFSLSLVYPNHLMESVKGTAVDIFGNILDLNRFPIEIGKDKATLNQENADDKKEAFLNIKKLYRRSLAFHFELNARKNIQDDNGNIKLPDINSKEDYAKNRGRFFIDVDKEGQFKINIPASSEDGNIPLLTRYENYSTFGTEDDGNPNKLIFREDNLDIMHDSFASTFGPLCQVGDPADNTPGVISVLNDGTEETPNDRIVNKKIKYGTAYHDLTSTCYVHQVDYHIKYEKSEPKIIDLSTIENLQDFITLDLKRGKNLGGRSGLINLDGSLDLNIGANTSDRRSLTLDLAGGILANIGRDSTFKSGLINMDGDLIVQIGGYGVSTDSRFSSANNAFRGAIFDVRVFDSGGRATMIRIDNNGVTVMTPGQLKMYSIGDMILKSDSSMRIDAEQLYVQGRMVIKELQGSI